MTCSPPTPFGCGATWGPPVPALHPDARRHVCILDERHDGGHACNCGALVARIVPQGYGGLEPWWVGKADA